MTGGFDVKFDQMCTKDETVVSVNLHSVLTDGTFIPLSEPGEDPSHAKKELYQCVDKVEADDQSKLVAIICIRNGCTSDFCVSKCCPENELFIHRDTFCSPVSEESHSWTADNKLHDQDLKLIPKETMKNIKVEYKHHFMDNHAKYKHRIPNCEQVIIMDKSNNDTFLVLQNGSLHHQNHGLTNNFCVDNTLDMEGHLVEIALKCVSSQEVTNSSSKDMKKAEAQSCLDPYLSLLRLFNTLSGLISCIFLIITFLVYSFVPELNNLHGKIIISNVFSIFLLTSYLLFVYNFTDYLSGIVCKIAGYSGYFFTMSMFAWMTIMSFDLCWTFMRAKVPRKGSALLKFVIYSGVAWGSSAVLTIAIILADQVMEDQPHNQKNIFPKPNVGNTKCFLEDDSQGLYLHFPILILMMINGMFFMITTITLYKSNLTTHQARYARQKTSQQVINTTSRINQETKEQLVEYLNFIPR